MVLIKQQTSATINTLPNLAGEVLYNNTLNRPIVNTSSEFKFFVLSTLTGEVTGLSALSATNLTGTLQTAAQPNITSLGTLTGLTLDGDLDVTTHDGGTAGLKLGGVLVTATAAELNYLDVTTPGVAEASKAVVLDANGSITGLTNVETDNLTVNGTLVTASAIELNYTDVTTIGVAQASKALVVDENLSIVGLTNLETDNLTVNGTLVTSSAIELNYVDVTTLGVAQASKALVFDANRDINNINHLTATTLTGLLDTPEQTNITKLGTLTELTVAGPAAVDSLTVGGVSLTPFGVDGLRARFYSSPDFNGRVLHTEVTETVDYTDYAPDGQTDGYSVEIWGYVKPAYSEDYTFTITSNDHFRLWINNKLVRYGWTTGDHNNAQTDPIALTADVWYPIYIQHVQESATERLRLVWESTSQALETIPKTALAFDDRDFSVTPRVTFHQDSLSLYDSTNSHLSSMSVNTSGDLSLSSFTSNVNVVGHNGSTKGLQLDGVLVTSTAAELNYVDVTTIGTAQASKAIVLDTNKDVTGIRNISTVGSLGVNTSSPGKQVEINSADGNNLRLSYNDSDGSAANHVDFNVSSGGNLTLLSSGLTTYIDATNNFDVVGHNGTDLGLRLAGVLVTSSANELNYVDITTPGTAEANKALILDGNKDISGINVLSATTINCDNLDLANASMENLNTTGNVGINTTALDYGLEVNHSTGDVLKLTYNDNDGAAATHTDFQLTSGGTLNLTTHGTDGNVNIVNHNGTDQGLQLAGVLVTATATQINYIDVTTPGTAEASKALVLDANSDIATINHLTATTLTGLLDTAAQTNITSVGTLTGLTSNGVVNIASHDGSTTGLQLGGVLVTSTAAELNYVDVTPGTAEASKALVLDANKDIATINHLTATTLTGTLDTAAQPNVTSVGLLNGLGVNDTGVTINTTTQTAMMNITGTDTYLEGTDFQKTLSIASDNADPVLFDILINSGASGTSTNSAMLGTTSTNDLQFMTDNTPRLTITADGKIGVGTTTPAYDFEVAGSANVTSLYIGGTQLAATAAELNYLHITAPGTAEATKALVLDANKDITGINHLTATTLTGTLDTAAQPNITSLGTLTALNVAGPVNVTGDSVFTGKMELTDALLLSSTADATDSTHGGAFTSMGGGAFAKNVFIGDSLDVTSDVIVHQNLTVSGPILQLPTGDTASRPTPTSKGQVRYNSETDQFEGFGAGDSWGSLGGVIDVDQDTMILAENGAGTDDDTLRFFTAGVEHMRLTATGSFGLGTSSPDKKLEINSATGDVLRLTFDDANGTAANFADFNVSSGGNLTINSSGDTTFIDASDSFDVAGHDGSTKGLKLAGVLLTVTAAELNTMGGITASTAELNLLDGVTATTTELNYVDTTPGAVEASKAVVVDGSRNVSNFNNLSNTGTLGVNTTSPDKQVEINSATGDALRLTYDDANGGATNYVDFGVSSGGNLSINSSGGTTLIDASDNFDVAGHDGSTKGLMLGGVLVTADAAQLNYTDIAAPGTAEPSKALVLDANGDVTGIHALTAGSLTADTFNAENLGAKNLTTTGNVGINTPSLVYGLQVNEAAGNVLRLTYNDDATDTPPTHTDFQLNAAGDLTLTTTGSAGSFDIANHNGTIGLKLAGVLVTSTATELNYVDVATIGVAEASKAVVLDANKDIATINHLTATTLTGLLDTAAQTNVTSVGTLTGLVSNGVVNIAEHNGTDKGLQLGGTLVTASAVELNYLDLGTPGTAEAVKALVVDSNRDIVNINNMEVSTFTATIDNATGNTIEYPVSITRTTSDTPSNGLGSGIDFFIENSANAAVSYGSVAVSADDITDGSEDGRLVVSLVTNGTPATALTLTNTSLTVQELVESSDRRIKENFNEVNVEETYNSVMDIKLSEYNYINDPETKHTGVIAQQLREVIPSAIKIGEKEGFSDFHSVSNKELIGYLIGSVQFLSKKIESLESKQCTCTCNCNK